MLASTNSFDFWNKFTIKIYFWSKTLNDEHHYLIFHILISLSTNFQFKLTIATFWTKFAKKGSYFQSKTDKIDTSHWVLHIRISLCIKFHFEQTVLNFWTKFSQERYLWSKAEKVNIIIEFRLFKLVLVPNFSLNWQFWFFWPDLPKKGFSGLKQKKWTAHIFYIILYIQINLVQNFSSNWQFCFFAPHLPKKVFPVENRKSEHHHEILHIWISLGTKYQLKLIILSFWTKFTQNIFPVKSRTSSPRTTSVCFLCGSTQTYTKYTKLKIYNHQTPKYSKGIWKWKEN